MENSQPSASGILAVDMRKKLAFGMNGIAAFGADSNGNATPVPATSVTDVSFDADGRVTSPPSDAAPSDYINAIANTYGMSFEKQAHGFKDKNKEFEFEVTFKLVPLIAESKEIENDETAPSDTGDIKHTNVGDSSKNIRHCMPPTYVITNAAGEDGNITKLQIKPGADGVTEVTRPIKLKDGEKVTFNGLLEGDTYTIKETTNDEDICETYVDGVKGTVTEDGQTISSERAKYLSVSENVKAGQPTIKIESFAGSEKTHTIFHHRFDNISHIRVEKKWIGDQVQEGETPLRPGNVNVTIKRENADGTEVEPCSNPITLSDSNNWKQELYAVPTHYMVWQSSGEPLGINVKPYQYKVAENSVLEDYVDSYKNTTADDGTVKITNTRVGTLTIEKEVVDPDGAAISDDTKFEFEVALTLPKGVLTDEELQQKEVTKTYPCTYTEDGKPIDDHIEFTFDNPITLKGTATVTLSGGEIVTIKDLPRSDNGGISYTVKETGASVPNVSVDSGNQSGDTEFGGGTESGDNAELGDKTEPDSNLESSGNAEPSGGTESGGNPELGDKSEDLMEDDPEGQGDSPKTTMSEKQLTGYETTATQDDGNGEKLVDSFENRTVKGTIPQDGASQVTFKNKTASLSVKKTVQDEKGNPNDKDKTNFTFSVTLTPLTGGVALKSSYIYKITDASNAVVKDENSKEERNLSITNNCGTFTLQHGQTATIYGLPIDTTYTVKEENSAGYDVSVKVGSEPEQKSVQSEGTLEADKKVKVEFINKKIKQEPETVTLTVKKEWLDTDKTTPITENLPESITVKVLQDNAEWQTVTLNAANRWQHTWSGLAKGHVYTAEEVTVPTGYMLQTPVSVTNDANGNVTITLTNIRTSNIPGNLVITKIVSGNRSSTQRDFTFTVILRDANKNLLTDPYDYTGSTIREGATLPNNGTLTADEQGRRQFSLRHGQAITISGLPAGTIYEISEEAGDYSPTISNGSGIIPGGGTITAAFENYRNGGGGGGGGRRPTPDTEIDEPPTPQVYYPGEEPDPNEPDSPDEITIVEEDVPQTYIKTWDPENEEYVYIPEEPTPLAPITPTPFARLDTTPKTDDPNHPWFWLGLCFASILGIGLLKPRKNKDDE